MRACPHSAGIWILPFWIFNFGEKNNVFFFQNDFFQKGVSGDGSLAEKNRLWIFWGAEKIQNGNPAPGAVYRNHIFGQGMFRALSG